MKESPRTHIPKRERKVRRAPDPTPYVVVEFEEAYIRETGIQYERGQEKRLGELWTGLVRDFPGLALLPLYPVVRDARFEKFVRGIQAWNERFRAPAFRTFYQVVGPAQSDFPAIAGRLTRERGKVHGAYAERVGWPAVVNTANQPLFPKEFHLHPPPAGLNAVAAWEVTGADGLDMRFVDVERGWDLSHPDLPPQRTPPVPTPLIHGMNDNYFDGHGTSVLGILCATDDAAGNAIGVAGFAPRAEGAVSSWLLGFDPETGAELSNLPNAILTAAMHLQSLRGTFPVGDVLLVEATSEDPANPAMQWPVEARSGNLGPLVTAAAAGIVVVEAGANGDAAGGIAFDADLWQDDAGKYRMKRPIVTDPNPDFVDSGAILVSAAQPFAGNIDPFAWSPRGRRVDCCAWGIGVTTCESTGVKPLDPYREDYDGTSAAAAIVAGAALSLQGIARADPRGPLTGHQVRLAFADPRWTYPATDPRIGPMPDLDRLVRALLAGDLHLLPAFPP